VSFLYPWAFWIAAAVVPALLILYFLKLRRREELVPSTLLWKRAVQDLQVNAPFQRLRKNLLLLLQLLVLLAGVFALARPVVQSSAPAEGRLVLLIDRSASMNTVEADGRTRLEAAKEQAARLVRTINPRSRDWLSFLRLGGAEAKTQAMVIAFADRATVVSPFTPNSGDLVAAINGIEPTDGQTFIREALDLAEAYMAPPTRITPGMEDAANATPVSAERPAKVVLFSDGALADVDEAVLREGQIELVKIGQTRDNVGITSLRTQRSYERPEILNVFLQVENFGDQAVSTDVSLYLDGVLAPAPVRRITLGPAATSPPEAGSQTDQPPASSRQALSFELALERAAVLEARLSRDDALASDNRAYAVIPPPRKLRVLVVTQGNFFLDSVLGGLPLEERVFVTPQQYEARRAEFEHEGRSTFDAVVFDKCRPRTLAVGNYLFLASTPPLPEIQASEPVQEVHVPIWWDETHPVLRHVALEYVYIGEGLRLQMPPEAETLIEGPRGPLLARYARDGRHCMILSFAVEKSTWWQRPSFPVFAYNALRYLGGGGAAEYGPVRPGDTLRVPLPEGVRDARARRPDGTTVPVQADVAGMVYFGGTARVGVYEICYEKGGGEAIDRYAVNLEDAGESNIRPRGATELARPHIKAGQAIESSTPEVWRWFVGVALLIVLLEWYIYNRRVMI